jgi:hypothetical protein
MHIHITDQFWQSQVVALTVDKTYRIGMALKRAKNLGKPSVSVFIGCVESNGAFVF